MLHGRLALTQGICLSLRLDWAALAFFLSPGLKQLAVTGRLRPQFFKVAIKKRRGVRVV